MQQRSRKCCAGFTLLELIIAIFIMGLLAGIAIPSYVHYIKKAYFSEVVQTADRYRLAVNACLRQHNRVMTECDAGKNGIPPNVMSGMGIGQVDSVKVHDAVITVTPKLENGITKKDTYILTPVIHHHTIRWESSGGGCTRNLAPDC